MMYGIGCEWDIGQERLVFPTIEAAWKWVEYVWPMMDFDDTGITIDVAKDDGLLFVFKYKVME